MKILLKKWSDQVNSKASGEHIWEMETLKQMPAISVANEDKVEGAETGVIGERQQQVDFTVPELFRRLRRIEKLTRLIK